MTQIECGHKIDSGDIDTSSAATDGIDVRGREDATPMLFGRCPVKPMILVSLTPRGISYDDLDGLTVQKAKTLLLGVMQGCNKRNTDECLEEQR